MNSMNIWSPWKKLAITLPDQSKEARAVGYAWAFYKIADHALNDILEKIPTRITERQVFNRYLGHVFSYMYPLERIKRSGNASVSGSIWRRWHQARNSSVVNMRGIPHL